MALSAQGLLDLLVAFFRRAPEVNDEQPHEPEAHPPTAKTYRVRRVGAWAGWSSMDTDAAVRKSIAVAQSAGLGRLDVIVNDHSTSRRERPFDTYPSQRVDRICKAAHDVGIETHLLSWLMPHRKYIERATAELVELTKNTGSLSMCFDAEEPWTRAVSPMAYPEAAELVEHGMGSTRWGVTAIGYASPSRLGPLVRLASYLLPQCYSTNNPKTPPPEVVVPRLVAHWKKVFPTFSAGEQQLVVGLAAYDQDGIAGHTAAQAIRASFLGAEQSKAVDVVYWSLGAIRKNPKVAAAIRELASRASIIGADEDRTPPSEANS